MLRRTTFVAFAIALALVATTAAAQLPCTIGAYGDEDGTEAFTVAVRDYGETFAKFDVYYVLFTEDFTNAVAWSSVVTGFNGNAIFKTGIDAVPTYGTFLDNQPEGYRLGIGTCKIGFGGVPITLMKETWTIQDDFSSTGGEGLVRVIPNVLENELYPVYNTCQDQILPCEAGEMVVTGVIPNDSESWGSVKALFK
jgi:hypothetical protein